MPFETGRDDEPDDGALALAERLSRTASALDAELVLLLEQQTDGYRTLDRRLGARRVLAQNEAHIQQMSELLAFALCGPHRTALAECVAEAAALAGWQALDLGRPDQAWVWHETARSAALDSGNPAVIAHVTAQQAFALLDLGRVEDAVAQLEHVRGQARGRVPRMLEAWLCASTAEALAAGSHDGGARTALDEALAHMACGDGDRLAYVFLNEVHLGRWRGHCLARLGASEAVDELESCPRCPGPDVRPRSVRTARRPRPRPLTPRRPRRCPRARPARPQPRRSHLVGPPAQAHRTAPRRLRRPRRRLASADAESPGRKAGRRASRS